MTNEQNFKKGDRVRFTGNYIHYAESALEIDKEYTVVSADEYGCDLSVQCTAYSVDVKDIELVEPYDRRTDFLRRLGALLREFNACICDGEGYMVVMELDSESDNSERLFFELIYQDYITADNIMDFDKE